MSEELEFQLGADVQQQMAAVAEAVKLWAASDYRRVEVVESFSVTQTGGLVVRKPGEVVRLTYALFSCTTGAQVGTIRFVIRAHLDMQAVWWEANGSGNDVLKAASVPVRKTSESGAVT